MKRPSGALHGCLSQITTTIPNHKALMSKSRKRQESMFSPVPPLRPKNEKQREYLKALQAYPQVFAVGPAGTGKTFLPSAMAADMLREKRVRQIIISKPNVPAGPSIGYFPGTLVEKMAPWVAP